MVFFKHNELLLPVKEVKEMHQNGGRREGAKVTKVWGLEKDVNMNALTKVKKIKNILLVTDTGEWISSGEAKVTENGLGYVIEPKEYYDIDLVDYVV